MGSLYVMGMELINKVAHVEVLHSENLLIILRGIKLDNDSVVDVEHLGTVSKLIASLGNQIELCEGLLEVIELQLQSGILVVSLLVNGTRGGEVVESAERGTAVALKKGSDVADSSILEKLFCHLCNDIISQVQNLENLSSQLYPYFPVINFCYCSHGYPSDM
jgi:hypothetical protein